MRLHQGHHSIGDVDETEDVGVELAAHLLEIETANLRPIRVAGVVDEHVDAAHALLAGLERPCVVVGDADIRADAVRAGLARDLLDAGVVAAGEDDLMPRLPRLFDDGRADTLTTAGY